MGCLNSMVIPAPVDKVWATLRNFHDMSWCQDVIQRLDTVDASSGTEIGTKRILNGVFHETLLGLDDTTRTMRYSIDDGPDAVSKENVQGYIGEIAVFPVTSEDHTFVMWTSHWESGGAGTKAFCDPIYTALLNSLKAHFQP